MMIKHLMLYILMMAALLAMGCSDGRQAETERFAAKYEQEQQRAKNMALPPPSPIVIAGDIRFGLAESKRREIFAAIVLAEDASAADVRAQHPDDVQGRYGAAGRVKAHADIARRYKMPNSQVEAIAKEGAWEKSWPLP